MGVSKMNEKQERSINKRKDRQTLLIVITVFAVIVAGGVFAFLRFYDSYIDGILYRERLKQMQEVTTQLFTSLEDVVQNQWDSTDVFCNYVERGKPQDTETLLTFITKQAELNGLEKKNAKVVAVDDLGRYLTQDGGRTVNLIYYGIAQDMTRLNIYFNCEAYDDSNSVYVLDKEGTRLFRSSNSTNLLRGYNAYATLDQMEYLHNNSFDEARQELEATGYGYANAVLDGREFYYAMHRMENAEWTLLFLVPSSYVSTDVVTMVNTTVKLIMAFAVLLLIAAASVIITILRFNQRQAVEAERRNSDALAKANQKLSLAAETAEKAEQAANSANKAKSGFLSNMSHDIRTPMNAIVGMTTLIEHEKNDPDKLDIYLEKIQVSSQHLLSLINDVLDMSKIESGDVSLNKDPVSLADEVSKVENIIRPQAEERGHKFTVRVHGLAHEYIICDAVRLRQVIINLLSNAVKYTHNGGIVSYDIEEMPCDVPDNAKIKFTVTDNGCGMSPEFVEHIFEPFVRAENSTTNKVQGTGLGMAITKSIVDMMGGTIIIQSEPNKGSRFEVTMTFPIDNAPECEVDVQSVLLISDDELFVQDMQTVFIEQKVKLLSAANISEAIWTVGKCSTDVILLSGYIYDAALGDNVRKLRESANGKVLIFCCDYAQPEQKIVSLKKKDVDGLIARPFFFSKFVRSVNGKLDSTALSENENISILNGMRFLCAEDNELNAEILTALLEMSGAACVIYPDGKEIVNTFADVREGDYDAILMDVQMPNMNGFEATMAIRNGNNPLGKTIPIIAMTANAFSSDIKACLEAGMDAHIPKPLDASVLEKNLRGLVTLS